MITEIKALLEATGQFKSVQLAQELQPVSDMATNSPAAIVYQGKTLFQPNSLDNFVRQAADKTIVVILLCAADDVETLENLILTTLLGYQHSANYEGLEALESDNHDIQGHYYARKIVFQTRTHISQI